MTAPLTPTTLSLMPTEDGGAVLKLDDTRVVLTIHQTNAILRGLLAVATIKIEPDSAVMSP